MEVFAERGLHRRRRRWRSPRRPGSRRRTCSACSRRRSTSCSRSWSAPTSASTTRSAEVAAQARADERDPAEAMGEAYSELLEDRRPAAHPDPRSTRPPASDARGRARRRGSRFDAARRARRARDRTRRRKRSRRFFAHGHADERAMAAPAAPRTKRATGPQIAAAVCSTAWPMTPTRSFFDQLVSDYSHTVARSTGSPA